MNVYCCLIFEEETTLWHLQIADSLRAMGCNVFVPPQGIGLTASWGYHLKGKWGPISQNRLTHKLYEHFTKTHQERGIDLFFASLFPFQFKPWLLKEVENDGVPSCYFFCDNFAHRDKVANVYSKCATINWVPEVDALTFFEEAGSRYIHLPMAANPRVNKPVDSVDENNHVSFVGSKTPYRRSVLGRLRRTGVPLKLYGDGWHPKAESYHVAHFKEASNYFRISQLDRYINGFARRMDKISHWRQHQRARSLLGEYIRLGEEFEQELQSVASSKATLYEDFGMIYAGSAVTVGLNEQFLPQYDPPLVKYSKLREFEIGACGGCYLAERTADQLGLFDEDKDFMAFDSEDELADKAKFLLRNEVTRKRLRQNFVRRVRAEHTWDKRFLKLFKQLGLGAPSRGTI